jgi:hypothetical protein
LLVSLEADSSFESVLSVFVSLETFEFYYSVLPDSTLSWSFSLSLFDYYLFFSSTG